MKLITTLFAIGLLGTSSLAMAEDMKMDMPKGQPKSQADADFGKSMAKMMSNMNVKTTGKPDEDFVRMMLPHHQGAVDMAKVELQYGTDPMMRKMAQDIVSSQEKEITEMKEWLAKNGK